jgi:hypothetical protein
MPASATPLFAAMFAIQAAQAGAQTYGNHQNWKAVKYVDSVHREITRKNADLSLRLANEQQTEAEARDRAAEGVDLLTSRINALRTRSSLKVRMGESGVTGTTQEDIMGDFDRLQASREGILEMNFKARRRERIAQRRAIGVNFLNNLAGSNTPYRPDPTNYGSLGLEIAGSGLGTYMDYQLSSREGANRAKE